MSSVLADSKAPLTERPVSLQRKADIGAGRTLLFRAN